MISPLDPRERNATHFIAEEDGGLQLLGLLLLLLDLGLQRIAEGLGPCAVEGEFRLVLLLLGFSHLGS